MSARPGGATSAAGAPLNESNIMKNEQLPAIEIKVKQPPVLFSRTQALIGQLSARQAAGLDVALVGRIRQAPGIDRCRVAQDADHRFRPSREFGGGCRHPGSGRSKRLCFLRRAVDYQLIFARQLDRQIGRLGTLQDSVDEICDAPVAVRFVRAVVHKPAGVYAFSGAGNGIKPNNLMGKMEPPNAITIPITRAAKRKPAPGPAPEINISWLGPKATFAQRLPHNVDSGIVKPPNP